MKIIGKLPVSDLAPLEYRYALDAAMPIIAACPSPLVICNSLMVKNEVQQRITATSASQPHQAGLWVEPLVENWETDLQVYTQSLVDEAPLLIILSRPFARIIPERQKFPAQKAIGMQPAGIYSLKKKLLKSGFRIENSFGIHTFTSIGINLLSQMAARLNRPALSDRLLFKSKLHYCKPGSLATFSTVGLIFATKVVG